MKFPMEFLGWDFLFNSDRATVEKSVEIAQQLVTAEEAYEVQRLTEKEKAAQ